MAPKITDEEIRKEADKLHNIWWDRNTENDITDTLIEAIKKGIQMKQEKIKKKTRTHRYYLGNNIGVIK